jgi:hypothetical protein
MAQIFKSSRATVRTVDINQRYIYIVEAENPELPLAKALKEFLETVGYSSIFPNFNRVRVGTIHPFAILLAQEVLGENQNVNIFPSITIADTSLNEDAEVLADDYRAVVFSPKEIGVLDGFRQAGKVFVSDAGWQKIQDAINATGSVVGIVKRYHTGHSLDFNIWSENKEITSFLFDMVCHFVTQERVNVHNRDGLDLTQISGRRSGDINLDFGKLLYGANVSVSMAMNHEAILIDTGVSTLDEIDMSTLPTFFTLGAING